MNLCEMNTKELFEYLKVTPVAEVIATHKQELIEANDKFAEEHGGTLLASIVVVSTDGHTVDTGISQEYFAEALRPAFRTC